MKKRNIIIIGVFILILVLFCLWYFYLRLARENRLIEDGNIIINKIEFYRTTYNKLPESLTDIGINVIDESDPPYFYQIQDSIYYSLSFGISFDETKTYYSDTKTWEDLYRKMGNVSN
mgnify:CR=1 FL=1